MLAFVVACGGGPGIPSPTPAGVVASYTPSPTPQASRLVDIETFHLAQNTCSPRRDTEEARVIAEREIEKLNLAPGSTGVIVMPFAEED